MVSVGIFCSISAGNVIPAVLATVTTSGVFAGIGEANANVSVVDARSHEDPAAAKNSSSHSEASIGGCCKCSKGLGSSLPVKGGSTNVKAAALSAVAMTPVDSVIATVIAVETLGLIGENARLVPVRALTTQQLPAPLAAKSVSGRDKQGERGGA